MDGWKRSRLREGGISVSVQEDFKEQGQVIRLLQALNNDPGRQGIGRQTMWLSACFFGSCALSRSGQRQDRATNGQRRAWQDRSKLSCSIKCTRAGCCCYDIAQDWFKASQNLGRTTSA